MRMLVALPLLLLPACDVQKDAANDQVTLEFNEEHVENAAESVGNAAERAASEVGNAAERAGQAIENEVGDIDVDVDVGRDKADNAQ